MKKYAAIVSALALLFIATPASAMCIGAYSCGGSSVSMRGNANGHGYMPQYSYSKPQHQYYKPYYPNYSYQTYSHGYPQYQYYQPAYYDSYYYSNSWHSSSWYDSSYSYNYYDDYWY